MRICLRFRVDEHMYEPCCERVFVCTQANLRAIGVVVLREQISLNSKNEPRKYLRVAVGVVVVFQHQVIRVWAGLFTVVWSLESTF